MNSRGIYKITEDFEKALCELHRSNNMPLRVDNASMLCYLCLCYEVNLKEKNHDSR
jgi:hypothetical protein